MTEYSGVQHYQDEYGDEFMEVLEGVVMDGEHLEAPCTVCGNVIYPLEPDAESAWCDVCDKVQPVGNALIELGVM